MSIRTIQRKDKLQGLISEYPLVIVAGLRAVFQPGDIEFERLAQENDRGRGHMVFDKFILKEVPQLDQDLGINDIDRLITFYHGEKYDTAGVEPPRWEGIVKTALDRVG